MWWDCLSQNNVTHLLLIIGKDVMDDLWQNVQCHSLPVDHRRKMRLPFSKWCNVTYSLLVIGKDVMRLPFKMFNVTYRLLVIGKDVMKQPFIECAMSLTRYWSYICRKRCDWDCLSQNMQCHSLSAIGQRKRCDEIAFQKMCNVTHSLLRNDVMRLLFTKCIVLLTSCWS